MKVSKKMKMQEDNKRNLRLLVGFFFFFFWCTMRLTRAPFQEYFFFLKCLIYNIVLVSGV